MIQFKQLRECDEQRLYNLYEKMQETLESKDWWLPLTEEEKILLFKSGNAIVLGLFDDDKLVGTSVLLVNKNDIKDYLKYFDDLMNINCGKIGRCVVLPEYRGNNYMYQLNCKLVQIAKEHELECLIAIAHPDNVASNKSLTKLGMKIEKTITKDGKYKRNIYLLHIKK